MYTSAIFANLLSWSFRYASGVTEVNFSCFVLVYVPIELYSCKAVCQQSLFCISDRINNLINR